MEIHRSARRHGIRDDAIRHATDHPLVVVDLDPDGDPPRQLAIGPDLSGNLLEVIARPMTEKNTHRTKTGKVLTDADIEAMADEAEWGYDVETLLKRRRGRPMLGSAPADVVPVRLDPDLKEAVEARAAADRTTTSEIIREALRRYLDVA